MSTLTILNLIFQVYFQNCTCIYYINENTQISISTNLQFVSLSHTELKPIFDVIPCNGFMIISSNLRDKVAEIENQLRYVRTSKFNTRRYLLLAPEEANASHLFAATAFAKIVDVVLLNYVSRKLKKWKTGGDCFEVFNHRYVGKMMNNEAVFLGKVCDGQIFNGGFNFGEKLRNQMGRQFTVSTFNFSPYVNLGTMKGAELSIIITFIERYNLTMKLLIEENEWGYVSGDYVGEGSQYRSATGEADVSIGGFYRTESRYFYNDMSEFTLRNGLSCLVPIPIKIDGLFLPIKPLTPLTWLLFLIIYLCSATIYTLVFLIRRRKRNHVFLKTFGLLLQQNIDLKLKGYWAVILLTAILFNALYSSGLSSLVTTPSYEDDIKTVDDLRESNLHLIGYSYTYIATLKSDRSYKSIVNKFITMDKNDLDVYIENTKEFALSLDHLDLGYSLGEYAGVLNVEDLESFKVMKEDLFFEYCVLLATKHSVIIPLLNQHILQVKEAGLDYYWQSEAFRDLDYKIQVFFMHETSHGVMRLTLKSFEGAFALLALGACLAFLLFVCEILQCHCIFSARLRNKKL